MNIFSLLSILASLIYLYLGCYVFRLDPKRRLNRIFLLLCSSFAIWAFAYSFVYSAPSKEILWIWFKLSSIGWCTIGGISLHFFLVLTGREKIFKQWWPYIPLYLPGIVLIYVTWTGTVTASDFIQTSLSWHEVFASDSLWFWISTVNYSSCIIIGITLTCLWGRKSKLAREKKQARTIVFAAVCALVIGTIFNIILPLLNYRLLPSIAPIASIIWASGAWYVIAKYKLMVLTPKLATDEIASRMSDSLILLEPQGRIVKVNRQTAELLGIDAQELLGKPIDSIIYEKPVVRNILTNLPKNGGISDPNSCWQVNFVTKQGERIPVTASCSIMQDNLGDLIGIIIMGQDMRQTKRLQEEINLRKKVEEELLLSKDQLEYQVKERTMKLAKANEALQAEIMERKQAEEALKESEERYRLLYEYAGDSIYTYDLDLRLTAVNRKACETIGYSEEELLGRNVLKLGILSPEDFAKAVRDIQRLFAGEKMVQDELRYIKKDGSIILGEVIGAPLFNREGKIIAITSIVRDISDRKKMEEELIKSKKLESIGILAGGIAHDFNNLLTAILGNVSLVKRWADPEDVTFKRLTVAEKAILMAEDLTRQLLTFSKGGEPIKKLIDMNDLLRDSVRIALSGSNIKCDYHLPATHLSVEVDEGQMRQVIHNLVINAKEAMPAGGVITISAGKVMISDKETIPLKKGEYVKFSIEDRGRGIPEALIPKIFDLYFSTKQVGGQKGTGLGLSICYSIVNKHNGYITVDSSLGKGTAFHVYIPASEKEVVRVDKIEEKPKPGEGRILLMDDEEIVREIIGEILTNLGYEVLFAKDGTEAIEVYQKTKETGISIDAVILDLTVPGGMGGKEAIKKLMAYDPDIKAIVMSGYSNDAILSEFKQHGFRGALVKPFKIVELSEILLQVITA